MKPFKKLLSLFISFIMLFNLTADIFAAPQLATKEQRNQITNTLNDAYLESLENNPQTQNKNTCESFTKSKEEYQKIYETNLTTFTKIAKEYNDLGELFNGALKSKTTEESLIDQVNEGLKHYQKEIDEYNELSSLYQQKVEDLGGMDTIEQEYDLYQNWLALKDEMTENKKQQEEILSTSQAALEQLPKHSVKKAVKEEKNTLTANINEAKQKLQDYQENYFNYQERFNTFAAEFNSLSNWENELKNTEYVVIDRLNNLINDIENGKREKQHYLEEFSLDQDFDKDSDWNDIFKSIQTIVDKKERELNQAKAAFKSAETNLYSKEACDFQRRMESALKDAEEKFCNAVKDHYDAPIEIKEDPFISWIYSGSEIRKLPTKWKRTKDVYKACVNPVWGDRQLRGYANNITLSDMSDYKYGEYLLKYPLQEGKTLSLKEEEEIGQKLAQKVRDMVLVDVDKAIKMHYNIIGDRQQALILAKQLEEDWRNLGGEVSSNVEDDSGFSVNNVKLSGDTTTQLRAKKLYYAYKHKVFLQVNNIGRFYTREIKGFMTGFIAQIAHDKSTENISLLSSVKELKELGVSEEDINKAYYYLTWSFSQQEIEQETDKYVASIQKRPFKPAMFLIAPYSTIVDSNRELVRKRRNARTGVKLDTSEYLQNILLFNAHLQDQDRENLDKGNLTAWNILAEAAYYRKAYYLLNDMVKLGYSMGSTYLEKPLYYSNEIEKSLHEYAQDTLIDICIGIAISQFISIGKAMIKTSLKATINSSMRKGIAMTMKRNLALLNKNVKSESINILNRTAGKDFKFIDKSALKYSQRDMSQIKKFRLKTPIGQTSHTLGRELGANNAFVNKNIKNIKTKYTRPSAAQNSKVFNREFTEKQYKQLSNDLKDFYKQPRPKLSKVNISAKNVSQETANISPALNETSAANKSSLYPNSPMQKIMDFNKELKNKVAASIKSLSLIFNPVSYKNLFTKLGNTFKTKSVRVESKNSLIKKALKRNEPKRKVAKKSIMDGPNTTIGDERFVEKLNQGNLEQFGTITIKELPETAKELQQHVDDIIKAYNDKGAIVYEEDLRGIIKSEKNGGLLENVTIPDKLNDNKSWTEFYNNLQTKVKAGDEGAIKFNNKYLSNILEPSDMIVFDYKMNIPGMNPNYPTAMSIEKAAAAQSDKRILTLTDRGLVPVNAHQEPVGKNIHQILTGKVEGVFERQEAGGQLREFVILDWNEQNIPNAIVLEVDNVKGVNVVTTNFHPKNINGLYKEFNKTIKETSDNAYKRVLYINDNSASKLNNLNTLNNQH